MTLQQILYVSMVARPLDEFEIANILHRSRRNNYRLNITGCLLWTNRLFLQVLEGPDNDIADITARIKRDNRHQGFTILRRQPIARRMFPDWSMGYLFRADLEDALATLIAGAPPEDTPADLDALLALMRSDQLWPAPYCAGHAR